MRDCRAVFMPPIMVILLSGAFHVAPFAASETIAVDTTAVASVPAKNSPDSPQVGIPLIDTLHTQDSLLAIDSASIEGESEDSLTAFEDSVDSAFQANADTAEKADTITKPFISLYPGVSVVQDSLADVVVRHIWKFEWDDAEKMGRKLQKLERKDHLPSLSSLLLVSACIVRTQNGVFSSERAEKNCLKEIEKNAKYGLERSDPSRSPDSLLATNLLIYGGIKGLLATLQINRNVIVAAIEGLNALSQLEKCVSLDPSVKDVYLGMGIFYCALSKASAFVRGALKLIGRPVSLDKGLDYLHESAYHGRYTAFMAKIYLVQFLSPYRGDQANEKRRIFKSLETSFSDNPYFLFLRLEENLCFHPEKVFDPSIRRTVRKKITAFNDDGDLKSRYAMLVRWQYLLIDPFAAESFRPDTSYNLREFSYYPVFLSALREKYAVPQSEIASPSIRKRRVALIRKIHDRAMKLLDSSAMNVSWSGFYAWHIRDALRMED